MTCVEANLEPLLKTQLLTRNNRFYYDVKRDLVISSTSDVGLCNPLPRGLEWMFLNSMTAISQA